MKKSVLMALVMMAAAAVQANATFNTTCFVRPANDVADDAEFTKAVCINRTSIFKEENDIRQLTIFGSPVHDTVRLLGFPYDRGFDVDNVYQREESAFCSEGISILMGMKTALNKNDESIDLARTSFTAKVSYSRDICHSSYNNATVTFTKMAKQPSSLTYKLEGHAYYPKMHLTVTGLDVRGNRATISGDLEGTYPVQMDYHTATAIIRNGMETYKVMAEASADGRTGVPEISVTQDAKNWVNYSLVDAK